MSWIGWIALYVAVVSVIFGPLFIISGDADAERY